MSFGRNMTRVTCTNRLDEKMHKTEENVNRYVKEHFNSFFVVNRSYLGSTQITTVNAMMAQ